MVANKFDGCSASEEPQAPISCIRELKRKQTVQLEVSGASLAAPRAPSVPAPSWRAADAIVSALLSAGVDTFFGIPGGPVSPIFDAILTTQGVRLIESRHETGAAFAAAGYYRATGKVPCVVVTAGPGATNVVTGVASAHLEQTPMLVICGDVAWQAEGGRLLQDSGPEGVDIERMLGPTTRISLRLGNADSASAFVLAALRAATNPVHRGPALLVVPIHHATRPAPTPRVEFGQQGTRPLPRPDLVRYACERLTQASRPLLVIGAGAREHAEALKRLVDVFDVPFVTTPRAKGLVSELHPRSLRHGGLAASMWARKYTEAGVDVALVLGTDLDDCSVGPTPYVQPGGELIHVDLNAAVFSRNIATSLGVVADVGAFVRMMIATVKRGGYLHGKIKSELVAVRAQSAFDVAQFREHCSPSISPYRALADLEAAAGPDARFVTDIGEHMLFALHYLTARGPDRFLINLGLGSMGSGIGSSIGLAVGDPTRRVVCICGDGGMQMAGGEVLVAFKERLPIVFAVFNDARYNMVYHGYKQVFGREAAWETPWVDFAAWAKALQVNSVRINHPGEITQTLLDRMTEGGPCLLDVRIERGMRLNGGGRNEALRHMSMLHEPESAVS
jgi:acetolactate synthase-1/2/3 large subunit